jgi:putative transposase
VLKEYGMRVSMSRTGNPYDNAQAESFIKTLTYEEVALLEYQNLAEARGHIGHFIEEI